MITMLQESNDDTTKDGSNYIQTFQLYKRYYGKGMPEMVVRSEK
jgi:hypothetical protein